MTREGGKQTTTTEHADIRATLAEMFKDGLPEWIPAINVEGDSSAITDTAQPPPGTTSVPISVANHPWNHVEQVSHHQPSLLLHPESADERAGAFTNLFPVINRSGELNVPGTIITGTAQPPTMSVPETVPVTNHSGKPSFYVPPLFNLENIDDFLLSYLLSVQNQLPISPPIVP